MLRDLGASKLPHDALAVAPVLEAAAKPSGEERFLLRASFKR